MKVIVPLLIILCIASNTSGRESIYTGSTPAAPVVRTFLGIPLSDSIDFIRWKIVLDNGQYQLSCNYGISKANTSGFINGGAKVELSGRYKKENNYIILKNGSIMLRAVQLNENLLHLLGTGNQLLVGNGGWSYTLNSVSPQVAYEISIVASPAAFKDSIAYEGRTPCGVPGVIDAGSLCYKLKWYIVLYPGVQKGKEGTFKILGTRWRREGGVTGNWKLIAGKKQAIYQLDYGNGKGSLYLLRVDDHIMVFTDEEGKPLVGDKDFSYTLNSAS